jgi:predicted O-methyltransferase YrrM
MKNVRSLAKSVYRKLLLPQARAHVARLSAHEDMPAPLLRALAKTFANEASADEAQWLARISALHAKLERSDEEIEFMDFGAGSPESNRSSDEMSRGVRVRSTVAQCARASKDNFWGKLLFMLVREFKPQRALELGTNLGVSAAYQAAAMTLNGTGNVITIEGAPTLAARARENLSALDLRNVSIVCGKFTDMLPTVCAEYAPFDFVFIDGHHDRQATIDYFNILLPFTQPNSVCIFDDIRWSDGMIAAWDSVRHNERVQTSVGLKQLGICVIGDGQPARSVHETIALV